MERVSRNTPSSRTIAVTPMQTRTFCSVAWYIASTSSTITPLAIIQPQGT
jgi:hypothetical protein